MSKTETPFEALNIAVLTISDTRTPENDTSGDYLTSQAKQAGHNVVFRSIVIDDVYLIRAVVSAQIADPKVQAILITGGTGFTHRDSTPEAVTPLFDKQIEGFGELFRHISYQEIGTSTVQSRAIAGMANKKVIFCMPGSTGACKTAWQGILKDQLDSTHRPCNFAPHIRLDNQ
ncbi:molybdenum cofactor biosynthesis protein B [Glaciecola sp. SC05]|uniref:molybdenum cofactor biosynthesis protein B n=1 Tax=Glaciecola sp. SC05 TaxID=1987355 RepID=UPI0035286BF8